MNSERITIRVPEPTLSVARAEALRRTVTLSRLIVGLMDDLSRPLIRGAPHDTSNAAGKVKRSVRRDKAAEPDARVPRTRSRPATPPKRAGATRLAKGRGKRRAARAPRRKLDVMVEMSGATKG